MLRLRTYGPRSAAIGLLLAGLVPALAQAPSRGRQPPAAPAQPQTQPQAQPAPPPAQTPAPAPKPERTEISHFDNWNVTCQEFAQGPRKRACSAQLQVRQANSNVVFAWTIALDEQNRPINVLTTPTGVLLARGVELRLDKAAARTVAFTTCDTGRCTAVIAMDDELARGLAASERAEATIYALNGSGVRFAFQLKGFDKAYAALRR